MKDNPKEFIKRSIILAAALFIIWSLKNFLGTVLGFNGLIGPYGNVFVFYRKAFMQAFIVTGAFFIIYNRESLSKVKLHNINYRKAVFPFVLAITSLATYYLTNYYLRFYQVELLALILLGQAFGIIMLSLFALLLTISVFGIETIGEVFALHKRSSIFYLLIFVVVTFLLVDFQKTWPFFSNIVTMMLVSLYSPFYLVNLRTDGINPILSVNGFTVSIGEPCSGIDSMMLFLAFFLGIFALDHVKIDKLKFFLLAAAGFVGIFFVNVLRLWLLILVGVHISPDLAVGLFHTNAGWVLFVIYFLSYFWLIRRFIYIKEAAIAPSHASKARSRAGKGRRNN